MTDSLLAELRQERAAAKLKIEQLESAISKPALIPTEDQVLAMLQDIEEILEAVCRGDLPAEVGNVRKILLALTGGGIALEQMGEKRPGKGWVRAGFTSHLFKYLLDRSCARPTNLDVDQEQIYFEIRTVTKRQLLKDRAYQLHREQ